MNESILERKTRTSTVSAFPPLGYLVLGPGLVAGRQPSPTTGHLHSTVAGLGCGVERAGVGEPQNELGRKGHLGNTTSLSRITQIRFGSQLEATLVISHRGLERRLVPQDPARQSTRSGRVSPVFAHVSVAFQVATTTRHILVLGKIRHTPSTERGGLGMSVRVFKHRIKLLLGLA